MRTGASVNSLAAYDYLLTTRPLALGEGCGDGGQTTELWFALTQLVHERETPMLWDLASRAATTEARATGVIGLVKLDAISAADGRAMLELLPAPILTCGGCIFHTDALPTDAISLFDYPLVGDDWEPGTWHGLELPGAPRMQASPPRVD